LKRGIAEIQSAFCHGTAHAELVLEVNRAQLVPRVKPAIPMTWRLYFAGIERANAREGLGVKK
jgi:hypothetical protein